MISESMDRSWKIIAEAAKACREFNELQFKYRQLVVTLLIAAFGSMGYLWTSADTAAKSAAVAMQWQVVPPCTVATGKPPAAAQPTVSCATLQMAPAAGASSSATGASADAVHRVTLLLAIVGLVTSLATLMIWYVDCGIYHRLLSAVFWETEKFEAAVLQGAADDAAADKRWNAFAQARRSQQAPGGGSAAQAIVDVAVAAVPATGPRKRPRKRRLEPSPRSFTVPLLHVAMSDALGKTYLAGRSISWFYILGALAAYLPVLCFAGVNDADDWEAHARRLALAVMGVTLAGSLWFLFWRVEKPVVERTEPTLLELVKRP